MKRTTQSVIFVILATIVIGAPVATPGFFDLTLGLMPILLLLGVGIGVRKGRPQWMPTWVIFNANTLILGVYSAWAVGSLIPPWVAIAGAALFVVYDITSVHLSGYMEAMSKETFGVGYPAAFILPHNVQTFSYEAFVQTVKKEGLVSTHDDPETGVSMLGIGDVVIPGAIAVSIRYALEGTEPGLAIGVGSLPPVGSLIVAVGGLVGITGLLIWEPRKIAALTVIVPVTIASVGIGIVSGAIPASILAL